MGNSAGVPKAVRAWFYPGDNFGQEFAYPKKLVAQLASAAPVSIPSDYREPNPQPEPTPEIQPAAPVAANETAAAPAEPAPAPEPAPQQVQQPQPTAPAAQPAALPHTASFNPLVGFVGFACLSFAGLLTLATRRA